MLRSLLLVAVLLACSTADAQYRPRSYSYPNGYYGNRYNYTAPAYPTYGYGYYTPSYQYQYNYQWQTTPYGMPMGSYNYGWSYNW